VALPPIHVLIACPICTSTIKLASSGEGSCSPHGVRVEWSMHMHEGSPIMILWWQVRSIWSSSCAAHPTFCRVAHLDGLDCLMDPICLTGFDTKVSCKCVWHALRWLINQLICSWEEMVEIWALNKCEQCLSSFLLDQKKKILEGLLVGPRLSFVPFAADKSMFRKTINICIYSS